MVAVMAVCVAGSAIALFAIYALGIPFLLALALTVLLIGIVYMSLSAALEKVSRILQSQRLFVSNIQHELRGPMSVMQIDGELALNNISLTELSEIKSRELIGAVRADLEGLRQMSNIIKNLSLLVAQEYNAEKPEFKKLDLNILLERLCLAAEKLYADKKDIKIRVETEVPAFVQGNESALEQIVMNLLLNAVKYSPKGTTIVASTMSHDRGASLSIRDHGIGISEHDLPHILNPFYRATHSGNQTHNEKGTGLGLAIVAALAKQHQAIVTIASVLKKGTTVTLNFPLMPVAAR